MKTTLAITAVVALVFTACNAVEQRSNDAKDITEATKVADGFINSLKAKDYTKAMEFTQISKDNPDYASHIDIFKDLDSKLGSITTFKQDTATATVAQEGNSIEGVFRLKYTVDYEQGKTQQDYTLQYNDGKIIVMSYIITTE